MQEKNRKIHQIFIIQIFYNLQKTTICFKITELDHKSISYFLKLKA